MNYKFSRKDYIIYLLQQVPPEKADKLFLNKLAFFVEFGFYHLYNKELSANTYAAINKGPVINDYAVLFQELKDEGWINITSNHHLALIKQKNFDLPEEIKSATRQLIEKYGDLTTSELIALSHATDSYLITTKSEQFMGGIIDKQLALLETIFSDDASSEEEIDPRKLPHLKSEELHDYQPE